MEGKEYQLATNNGPNHLHGGNVGFSKVMWQAAPFKEKDEQGVRFHYNSKDGEEGYPGLHPLCCVAVNSSSQEI